MQSMIRSSAKWLGMSAAIGAALAACSSTPPSPPPAGATCDDAACGKAGNACITGYATADAEKAADPKAMALACRRPCDVTDTDVGLSAQDKCPTDYHCSAGGNRKGDPGSSVAYCVKDRTPYGGTKGQWGTSCNPQQGYDVNPACDSANNFWCYANAPDDGSAICTQFQCADDYDCRGGYFCATINQGPNAKTTNRSYGKDAVTTACLPRAWNLWPGSYCATCKTDVDCPLNNGNPQHCVGADGAGGAEKICAVDCASDKSCNLDQKCMTTSEGVNGCVPRAATCKGSGDFCSPCRSDADCTDGFCTAADYSTERFCTKKSGKPCSVTNNMLTSDCPGKPADGSSAAGVSCYYRSTDGQLRDQCIGLVSFGGSAAPGCWTVPRK